MDHLRDAVTASARRRSRAIVVCAHSGVALLMSAGGHAVATPEPDRVLSRGFVVYSDDRIVANHSADGLTPRRVPIWNQYLGPVVGGYVACY